MSDGFELYLTNGLKNATAKLQEARHRVMELERDSNYFEKHLAIHLQMKEDEDPPTQAFPPVPPGVPDHVMPCPACGAQRYQEDDALLHVASGRENCPPAASADPAVTLTDPDATPKDGADHDHR